MHHLTCGISFLLFSVNLINHSPPNLPHPAHISSSLSPFITQSFTVTSDSFVPLIFFATQDCTAFYEIGLGAEFLMFQFFVYILTDRTNGRAYAAPFVASVCLSVCLSSVSLCIGLNGAS